MSKEIERMMPEASPVKPHEDPHRDDGWFGGFLKFRRHACAYCLAALVLMLVSAPFLEYFGLGNFIRTLAMSVVLMSAVLAVGRRRSTLIWAMMLMVPALLTKWVDHVHPGLLPPGTFQALAILFMAFVVAHLLRYILRAPRVDSEVLCAGIAGYLMLAVLWTLAYTMVAELDIQAFEFNAGPPSARSMQGYTAIYFSFVTLSTVGFGDIAPVSSVARMLATSEAVVGLFYITLLISRLVAVYSSEGLATSPVRDRGGNERPR